MAISSVSFAPPSTLAIVAVLALVVLLVPAIAALIAARRHDIDDTPTLKIRRYVRTMLVLWTLAFLAAYALSLRGLSIGDVGVRPADAPLWYVAGPVVVVALLLISGGLRGRVSRRYADAVRIVVPTGVVEWTLFVAVAATAAICEEFLYRGFALTEIGSFAHSLFAGMLLSSVAFGLGHAYQGRVGIVGTMLTGLIYSALYVASGSLVPCIVAHFLQDVVGAAVLRRYLDRVGPPAPPLESQMEAERRSAMQ